MAQNVDGCALPCASSQSNTQSHTHILYYIYIHNMCVHTHITHHPGFLSHRIMSRSPWTRLFPQVAPRSFTEALAAWQGWGLVYRRLDEFWMNFVAKSSIGSRIGKKKAKRRRLSPIFQPDFQSKWPRVIWINQESANPGLIDRWTHGWLKSTPAWSGAGGWRKANTSRQHMDVKMGHTLNLW